MFKHGDSVRLKQCPLDREAVGKITSWPRANSRSACGVWPDGWAGWVILTAVEHVRKFDVEALHAARAAWVPSEQALRAADDQTWYTEQVADNVFHGVGGWRVQRP